MDFLEILLLLIFLEADLDPCSLLMGFHPAGVDTSQHDMLGKVQAVDLSEEQGIQILHSVLNGLVTRRSLHSERLVDVQIFRCVCYTAIRETKEDFKQEENSEMGEFEFSPLNWFVQFMKRCG